MNALKNKMYPLLAFTAALLAPGGAVAQDIEIYYSNPENSGQGTIVMMLDTSGSMDTNECVEFDDGGSCIRRAKRMDELKTALYRVVDTLSSNVKMGIGRYNQNDGGRLIYPVRGLDEIDFDGVSEFFLKSDEADGDDAPGESTDTRGRYENLPIGEDNNGVMGFVYEDAQIPRYADVTAAYLQVTAYGNSNDPITFDYWYEDVPSSRLPSQEELIGRPMPATTFVGKISENWAANNLYKIDITDGVKAALARTDWCGGNNLGIFMTAPIGRNDSDRYIYMRDALREGAAADFYAPRLIIEWEPKTNPPAGVLPADPNYADNLACRGSMFYPLGSKLDDAYDTGLNFYAEETDNEVDTNVVTGMRFTRIPFDLNGTAPDVVEEAKLHLQGDNNNQDFDLTIVGVPGSQPQFTQTPGYLKGLPKTTASKTVTIAKGTFSGRFEIDVSDVVREVMSHPDWKENGNIVFLLTSTRSNDIDAFEAGAAIAPLLELKMGSPIMAKFVPRARDKIKEAVGTLTAYGNTPSMEAYAEMARYMLGKNYRWARADVYTDVGMIGTGPQYESPLSTASCDSNNIVVLTDGSPTNDSDDYAVTSLTGAPSCDGGLNREGGSYNCQVQLSEWLYDGSRNGMGVPISTHTVAFSNDPDIFAQMSRVAKAGDGLSFKARNADELQAAFTEIVNSVTIQNASMAAPGVAVNQLNRFEFLNQLYYGLFKPATQTRWEGNLKRYGIEQEVTTDANGDEVKGDLFVADEFGNKAVDPNSGFFKETANSYWGQYVDENGVSQNTQDGQNVTAGGARQELQRTTQEEEVSAAEAVANGETPNYVGRRIYVSTSEPAPGDDVDLATAITGTDTVLWDDASDVSKTALGLPATASDEDREAVYEWLKTAWGDPLHSPPVLVNYGLYNASGDASKPDNQKNVVLMATNDGMLHLVEAKTGEEIYAWTPPSELSQASLRFGNSQLVAPDYDRFTYGLDGGVTIMRDTSIVSGERVINRIYAFVAQRRGGDKIHALDITGAMNGEAPKHLWTIDGGTGDYANLGQSWSSPVLTRVNVNGTTVPALIFGGGYDAAAHDTRGTISAGDSIGNSLYVVNANNGDLIWSVSDSGATVTNADMKWSVVGTPAIVDIDLNGLVDYVYFADLGGQVFRVDFNQENTGAAGLAYRVATVAKLGTSDTGGITNHRRFYAEPVVGRTNFDGKTWLQVGVGSGYRAHPLDEQTQDRIYVINDFDALNALDASFTARAPWTNGSAEIFNQTTSTTNRTDPGGWFINLEKGEKVISGGAIYQGVLLMSTYVPQANAIDRCTNVIGASRLYAMSVINGEGVADLDNDGEADLNLDGGRYQSTNLTGLPPAPRLIASGGEMGILVGTQFFDGGETNYNFELKRWFQLEDETKLDTFLQQEAAK